MPDETEQSEVKRIIVRDHMDVVSDQHSRLKEWMDENLDFILAETTLSDADLIDLDRPGFERQNQRHENLPRILIHQGGHEFERHNAANFLMWTVSPLFHASSFDDTIERLIAAAIKALNRQFSVWKSINSPLKPPAPELVAKLATEWLTIGERSCDLRGLLADVRTYKTQARTKYASVDRDLYVRPSRALREDRFRWPLADRTYIERWRRQQVLSDPFDRESITEEQRHLLTETLAELREEHAASKEPRYHQIIAQFSICYTLGVPALPWELIALARNFHMHTTQFFAEHLSEIATHLDRSAGTRFVQDAGTAQLNKMKCVALRDGHFFAKKKRSIPRSIPVIDRDGAIVIPELNRQRAIDIVMTGVNLPWRYMAELEDVDPKEELFHYLRAAEDSLRRSLGVPEVGSGWISEALLFRAIAKLIPDSRVVQHARPRWLGQQHLDVYIPSLHLAFEFQGKQHYEPIAFFGGESAFVKTQERDIRKRRLCAANGVSLIEIRYDVEWTEAQLTDLLAQATNTRSS